MKAKLLVKSVHCNSCKMLIESDVEDLGGKANVDVAKKTDELDFDEKKLKLQQIRDSLRAIGHESEIVN